MSDLLSISNVLAIKEITPSFYQDSIKGIYSYKKECRELLPLDARVICFHGKPRPVDVQVSWVVENWI